MGLSYMTKEQKLFKGIIKADLMIVQNYGNSDDKAERLLAAYHMQQAVEKTIKLKAELAGVNLWGHDISKLIQDCKKHKEDDIKRLSEKKMRFFSGSLVLWN